MAENYSLIRAPLEMYTAADVEPKEVKWLWKPYIPFGKVTAIQGDSGDGKSTFALKWKGRTVQNYITYCCHYGLSYSSRHGCGCC